MTGLELHILPAYIDPGSGSYAFQLAIAALFGAGYAARNWWSKVISHITRSEADGKANDDGRVDK